MIRLNKSHAPDGRPHYKLTTDDTIAIPGDIHIPFHDPVALATFVRSTKQCDILLIIGDLFDNYALSRFPKNQSALAKYTIRKEVEIAEKWFRIFDETYKEVIYLPGNHEERWNRLVDSNPALAGMDWWWPIRDIVPSRWELLDVDSRVELYKFGRRHVIEHGDKASRNSAYVSTDKLTNLYPNQTTIIGHNHRLGSHSRTLWINNRPTLSLAYSVGHLATISKLKYLSAPDWQQGGLVIGDLGIRLLSIQGNRAMWV